MTAEPMQGEKVRIDGDLREWPNKMTELGDTLSGSPDGDHAAVTLGYDDTGLYVVLKIFDKRIVRTSNAGSKEDHATLHIAFPKGRAFSTYAVDLFPGDPGKVAGAVKMGDKAINGAKIVEGPSKGGVHVEAKIPWSAFPEGARVRVGLRAAVSYTDVDSPGTINAVLSTAEARNGRAMPPLLTQAEEGLESTLLKSKGLSNVPAREAFGNVAGDGVLERVAIFGNNLAILGSNFRGGKEFYFAELGTSGAGMVTKLELVDFDGDGRDEIVIQKRIGGDDRYREVLTVMKVGPDDTPFQAFAHEVGIKTPEGSIANEVSIKGGEIKISQGKSEGFDPATYSETLPGDMPSAILPWESVGSRTFKWKGKGFEKSGETASEGKVASAKPGKKKGKKAKSAAAADQPAQPPPPRPPSADELLDRVYALYKKDRGVGGGKPTFDFVTDVVGDSTPERVLIHGKDIVVFGKGFRGGLSYAFIAVGVADSKDILDATARDLTGDGKAEIILRAVLHAKASKELGGGTVDRRALLIYGIKDEAVVRLFGAETSRAVDENQVLGAVAFEPSNRGVSIELRPSRAIGWTEKNYPFPPDTTTAGGLEPLLLPWGDMQKRKYRWSGSAFVSE